MHPRPTDDIHRRATLCGYHLSTIANLMKTQRRILIPALTSLCFLTVSCSPHQSQSTASNDIPEVQGEQSSQSMRPVTARQTQLREVVEYAMASGDIDRAVAALIALSQTAEMSELKLSAMVMLAEFYFTEGERARSISMLDDLVNQAPPMGEIELFVANMLLEMSHPERAIEHLNRALTLSPNLLPAHLLLQETLRREGRADQAAAMEAPYRAAITETMRQAADSTLPIELRLHHLAQFDQSPPDEEISRGLCTLLSEENPEISQVLLTIMIQTGTATSVNCLRQYASATHNQSMAQICQQVALIIEQRLAAD